MPPPNQQNRKNSQDPVRHWAWSPTKNLSRGGGARLRWVKPGSVKKNLSFVFHASGLGPCRKSSLLTRAEADGRNSSKLSSFNSPKKSSSSPKKSLLSWLLSGDLLRPTPMFSRSIWSLRTWRPRSRDKSSLVRFDDLDLGCGLGLGWLEEPEEDCDMEEDNSDERTRYIPLL